MGSDIEALVLLGISDVEALYIHQAETVAGQAWP